MTTTIDRLSRAARHGMVIRAECDCGNARFYRAFDLVTVVKGDPDPSDIRFVCHRCRPRPTVTVLEIDRDRMPKLVVWKPVWSRDGKVMDWIAERLK